MGAGFARSVTGTKVGRRRTVSMRTVSMGYTGHSEGGAGVGTVSPEGIELLWIAGSDLL